MIAILIAGAASVMVAFVASRAAPRVGFVDLPDEDLKTHAVPIAPVGGIGVYVGLQVGLLVAGVFDLGLLLATTLLLAAGLLDDRYGLSPGVRLAVEAGAGLVLGAVGDLPGSVWVRLGLAVILVIVAANAVNLVDGLDGLSGSTAGVTAVGLALLSSARGLDGVTVGAVLAGSLAGFLVLNWRPAKVFLGDGGAYVVGAALAYAMLASVPADDAYTATDGIPLLLLAVGMLGVIGLDLAVTLTRRRRSGRALFAGDRSHVYDQLHDRGWPVTRIVVAASAAQLAIVAVILLLDRSVEPWIAAAITAFGFLLAILAAAAAGFLHPDERDEVGGAGDIDP